MFLGAPAVNPIVFNPSQYIVAPKWGSSLFQAAAVGGLSYLAAYAFAPDKSKVNKYFIGFGSLAALAIFIQGKKLPEFPE